MRALSTGRNIGSSSLTVCERVARAREHPDNSPATQALWRQAAALVNASRGEYTDAEALAREALTHVHQTDSPEVQADAYCDLAHVLEAAGRRDEAIAAWHEALERYERKQIIPLARRVRDRLSSLTETPNEPNRSGVIAGRSPKRRAFCLS